MDVRKRSALSFLAAAAALVLLLAPDAEAYPKTRTVKVGRGKMNVRVCPSRGIKRCLHDLSQLCPASDRRGQTRSGR